MSSGGCMDYHRFELKEVNEKEINGIYIISGKIKVLTGLHIGGGDTLYEIGGIDNPVIKDPEGYPYIPGSSLKGKLRSVLEVNKNLVQDDGQVKDDLIISLMFGSREKEKKKEGEDQEASMKNDLEIGQGVLIFRDCEVKDKQNKLPYDFIELKYENTIDRKTGKTIKGGLRHSERVKAGTEFSFEIIMNLNKINQGSIDRICNKLNINDCEANKHEGLRKLILNELNLAMSLLEKDYLGGSGTRGYGKIEFKK